MNFKLDADGIGAMPINEKRYLPKKNITLWHGFYILAKNIMGKQSMDIRKLSNGGAVAILRKGPRHGPDDYIVLSELKPTEIECHSSATICIHGVIVLGYNIEVLTDEQTGEAIKNRNTKETFEKLFATYVTKIDKDEIREKAVHNENYDIANLCT